MLKYLCSIILGILIYILLNSTDGFSIGGLNPGDDCNPMGDDECNKQPGITCNIHSNPCRCNLATNKCESDIHVAGTTGSTSVTSVTSATTADGEEYILTGDYFHNAGIPIFVQYIVLNQHDNLDSIMANLMVNSNLPPIYLGELEKLAKSGGSLGRKVSRHFFIIDKKVYYMKKIDGVFKPKNFGLGNEPPILVNNRLYQATLEIGDDGLVRSILYLQITGTNGVILKMYHSDRSTLELVKNIIDSYIKHIYQKISSCSVIVESSGDVVGDVTISLKYLTNSEAPDYSIDTSDSSICGDINSVYRIYYFDKVEIDTTLNTNILVIDGTMSSGVRELLRVLVYNGNIVLKYIKTIASGAYGLVCVASNIPFDQFNSYNNTGDAALAVVFKIYIDNPRSTRSGQNDREIDIINRINGTEDDIENCLRIGEIISARILTDPRDSYNMAIMIYMDGTLSDLLINPEYNAQSNLPFQIANRLMIALLCVQNNGYDYTDLKSQNILYRCYMDNKLVISLGDLGSLHRIGDPKRATWTVETIEKILNIPYFNRSSAVVFIYGLVILEVYRLVGDWDEFERLDPRILILHCRFCRETQRCGRPQEQFNRPGPLIGVLGSISAYYAYIRDTTMPYINGLLDRLKRGPNYDEIEFIKGLLSRIFVRQDDRITLQEINQFFTEFSRTGVVPDFINCNIYNNNAVSCEEETDVCFYDDDTDVCESV